MCFLVEGAVSRALSMRSSTLEAVELPSTGDVLLVVWVEATAAGAVGCSPAGVDGMANFLTPGTAE